MIDLFFHLRSCPLQSVRSPALPVCLLVVLSVTNERGRALGLPSFHLPFAQQSISFSGMSLNCSEKGNVFAKISPMFADLDASRDGSTGVHVIYYHQLLYHNVGPLHDVSVIYSPVLAKLLISSLHLGLYLQVLRCYSQPALVYLLVVLLPVHFLMITRKPSPLSVL